MPKTIADGANASHIGEMSFELMKKHGIRIITVSDRELVDSMRFCGSRMKMVVEPTGCLGLAGLRKLVKAGDVEQGAKCGVIISGGNIDMERYCALISES